MENKQLLKSVVLIAVGAASRLLPHPANFTAITGVAIFSGNFYIPLISMLISDLIIGFDSLHMRLAVYGSIALAVLIGRVARKNPNVLNIAKSSLFSSVLFFVVTNFVVWRFGSMYSKDFTGLLTSYTLAIPFFKNAILGDFFYTGMLFGIQKILSLNTGKLRYNSHYASNNRGQKDI
jgi:hypothetical protein